MLNKESLSYKDERDNLRDRNQQLTRDINYLKTELPVAQNEWQNRRYDFEETKDQLAEARQKRNETRLRKERIELRLSHNSNEQRQREREMGSLSRENLQLMTQIKDHRETIENHQNQITRNESNIQSLTEEITNLETAIANLEKQILRLQGDIAKSQAEFQAQDQVAKAAESITAEKLAQYKEVKAAFDKVFDEAVAEGRSQGRSKGQPDGYYQGGCRRLYSWSKARNPYRNRGGALLLVTTKAKKQGTQQGKIDGYDSGFQAPTHRQEGFRKGTRSGI